MPQFDELDGEPRVSYGVKELLQDIRDSVRAMDAKLDSKADKAEVVALTARVSTLEDDNRELRVREAQRREDNTAHVRRNRWRTPLLVTVGVAFFSPLWAYMLGLFLK